MLYNGTASWTSQVRDEIERIVNKASPKEVELMVSNVTQVLKKEYETAMLIGEEKGKFEGKLEDAQKMLAKKLPEELIVDITGLTLEQIQALKAENKQNIQ